MNNNDKNTLHCMWEGKTYYGNNKGRAWYRVLVSRYKGGTGYSVK